MFRGKTILGIVPARGGSKRVPRKNLREVAGRPLIAWTIEQGRASRYLDRLIVSTEDEGVAAVARECGGEVPFLRPLELATDSASGMAPILHALEHIPAYDYVVVLQPTSPLRTSGDIDGAIETCVSSGAPACVAVTAGDRSAHGLFTLAAGRLRRVTDEKILQGPIYVLNGAVYVAQSAWLRARGTFLAEETVAYVMPPERSLDIDTEGQLARFAAAMGH